MTHKFFTPHIVVLSMSASRLVRKLTESFAIVVALTLSEMEALQVAGVISICSVAFMFLIYGEIIFLNK
jgi:hypothetical protein